MGLINYTQFEDGTSADANSLNTRFGKLFNLVNGNLEASNLATGAVDNRVLGTGSVTSDKLGFEQYTDDNGWLITDLGLVKLASKLRTFTVPQRNKGQGGNVTFDGGMLTDPVGFDDAASYNAIHTAYMTDSDAPVQWILGPDDDDLKNGQAHPSQMFNAYRPNSNSSRTESGSVQSWVMF